jgi:acetyl esterase/lipase
VQEECVVHIDPRLFSPDAIDAATRAAIETIEKLIAQAPPLTAQSPAEIRAARREGRGTLPPPVLLPHAETRAIRGPAGEIPLRIFRTPNARGVYLHIHGGGWTIGSADQQDPMLDAIARAARVSVVSVEYRLAPEHPYPAGPDDCEAAALWLAQNAQREFGSAALAIGGESAGAHLSAVTLLRLRARGAHRAFRAANLVYGCYDLDFTPSVRNWGERNLVLSTPIVEWFTDHFVPDRARRASPDASPLLADLQGLPQALFTVGTLDPLLDDSLFMAQRWLAAGNRAELAIYPGGIHGFNLFPGALGEAALRRSESFLADAFAGAAA